MNVKREDAGSPDFPCCGSTQMHRLGDGKSRVAGEDTPHAPRAFADPRACASTQLHRPGDGKSRVAGEDTPRLLRERSPIPGPPSPGTITIACILYSETREGLPVSSSVLWEQAKPGWRSAADTQ